MKEQKRLDDLFSRYIRNRDCPNGFGRCISCGAVVTPKNGDCGHYIPRQHIATRYDPKNCHIQCRKCNRMKDGNIEGYTKGLIRKYGEGIIDELNAKRHSTMKLFHCDYKELISIYSRP